MIEILKLALSKGFKYEYAPMLGEEGLYLLRVFSDEGDITAQVDKGQLMILGFEPPFTGA